VTLGNMLHDGQITRVEQHGSRAEAVEAAGLPE
jgi:hypothetical protein